MASGKGSSASKVKEICASLISLDDVTFERVMRRAFDNSRPTDLLKSVINGWGRTKRWKKKNTANTGSDKIRGYESGLDYLAATRKEEEILASLKTLGNVDYRDALVRGLDNSRSLEVLKGCQNSWLVEGKKNKRRSNTHESGSDSDEEDDGCLIIDVEPPKVEVIDIDVTPPDGNRSRSSSSSSPSPPPGRGRGASRRRISPSHSYFKSTSPRNSRRRRSPSRSSSRSSTGSRSRSRSRPRTPIRNRRNRNTSWSLWSRSRSPTPIRSPSPIGIGRGRRPIRRFGSPMSRSRSRSPSSRNRRSNWSRSSTPEPRPRAGRTRTPMPRSNSSSPEGRRTSIPKEPPPRPAVQKKKEPQKINSQLLSKKLSLQSEGLWTGEMEINWRVMEAEETRLTKEFEDLGKRLADHPEEHPKYGTEWKEFWENKAAVVEDAGGDAENYDYIPEWKEYWARRMESLLRIDFNAKLDEIRRKYGMDFDTLNSLRVKRNGRSQNPDFETESDLEDPQEANRSTWRAASAVVTSANNKKARIRPTPRLTSTEVDSGPSQRIRGIGGFDILQVLRRMKQLEGQLGILSLDVNRFLELADNMELSGRGSSGKLLDDVSFMELLNKCKYRFEALIKANVLPSDILIALKHTCISMDAVLETHQSRLHLRAKSTTQPFSLADRVRREPTVPLLVPEAPPIQPAGKVAQPHDTSTEEGRAQVTLAITKRMEDLPWDQKERIMNILMTNLIDDGREDIDHQDLLEYITKNIDDLIQRVQTHRSPPPPRRSRMYSTQWLVKPSETEQESSDWCDLEPIPTPGFGPGPNRQPSTVPNCGRNHAPRTSTVPNPARNQPPSTSTVPNPLFWRREELDMVRVKESEGVRPWTGDMETGIQRSIGSALPPLPEVGVIRAISPPIVQTHSHLHFQHVVRREVSDRPRKPAPNSQISDQFAKPNQYSDWADHGVPRESPTLSNELGSGFSCRENSLHHATSTIGVDGSMDQNTGNNEDEEGVEYILG